MLTRTQIILYMFLRSDGSDMDGSAHFFFFFAEYNLDFIKEEFRFSKKKKKKKLTVC